MYTSNMMRGQRHHRRGRRGRGRYLLQPSLLLMMLMGPAYGYELIERLKEYGLGDIDPSLIYRALHSLEADGLVTSTWDKKETQGPPRRVYALTELGNDMLAQHLEELKNTRARIEQLIQAYEKHMRNGSGDFHEDNA